MAENNEKKVEKKGKKIKRRLFLYTVKIIIILVCAVDWYFEVYGLPTSLKEKALSHISADDVKIKADSIYVGVINGLIIKNISINDSAYNQGKLCTATEARIPFYKSFSPIKTLALKDANISIPVFPESGPEGTNDRIKITNINTEILLSDNALSFSYLTGQFNTISFNLSGGLLNLRSSRPRLKKQPSANRKSFSPLRSIAEISWDKRAAFFTNYLKYKEMVGTTPAELSIYLNQLNIQNIAKHDITVTVSPLQLALKKEAFVRTSPLRINSKNNKITSSGEISVNTSTLAFNTSYNIGNKTISGGAQGSLSKDDVITFLPQIPEILSAYKVTIPDTSLPFTIKKAHYNFKNDKYSLTANAATSAINYNGSTFSDISAEVEVINDKITVNYFEFLLPDKQKLSGAYSYENNESKLKLAGAAKLKTIENLIPELPKNYKKLSLNSTTPLIFTATGLYEHTTNKFKTDLELLTSQLSIRGLELHDVRATATITPEGIRIPALRTVLNNTTAISADLVSTFEDKAVQIHINSKGSPLPILDFFNRGRREEILGLIKRVTFPEDPTKVDMGTTAYVNWSDPDKIISFIAGDIVINDFALKGHTFKHAAAQFYFDSSGLTVIPILTLEREEGQAFASFAVTNFREPPLISASHHFKHLSVPQRKVVYDAESTITGNVILDLIPVETDRDMVNLPEATKASSKGTIDIDHMEKTYLDVKVTDATYEWHDITITGVNTDLVYLNRIFRVQDATGKTADGDVKVSYTFYVRNHSSNCEVEAESVNLVKLLKDLHLSTSTFSKPGKLAFQVNYNTQFKEEGRAEGRTGKGQFSITDFDLWKIPVLNKFQSLIDNSWGLSSFGKISSIESGFTIKDDRIRFDSLETDGSIIALEGNGDYYFSEENYEFMIQAKILKNALPFRILSYAFNPLSWIFEAKLKGTGNDYEWKLKRGVKGLLGSE